MPLTLTALPAFDDNYIWALSDTDRNAAVVIDPGEAEPVLQWLQQNKLNLAAILITHHHHDHIGGIKDILKQLSCPVYAPAKNTIIGATHVVEGGERITIHAINRQFEVLAIPGHTLGHVAYYSAPYLFCGDTLFSAGCGRMFEGTPAIMQHSIDKITALPDDTLICCAHEYTLANLAFAQAVEPNNTAIQNHRELVQRLRDDHKPSLPTTLGLEKTINPFLRTYQDSIVAAAGKHAGNAVEAGAPTFKVIRQWKDNF